MKRARKASSNPRGKRGTRRLVVVLLTLGSVAALLFVLWRLGEQARRRIGPRDRYAVRFADIRCNAPPGTTRRTFLAEVRFNADAAPTFQVLDPDLNSKLTQAFATHPWVASVDAVTVEPPDVVSVRLTFRTPVLAIPTVSGTRAVDVKGVLLPATAPTAKLPELLGTPPLPSDAPAGKPWPDETVVRAAPVAAEYRPRTIERTEQGWQLVMPDGKKLLVGR